MESQPSSNSCAFLPGSTKQAERSDHCGWAVPCFDRSRGGARLPVGAHLATSAARSTTLLRRVGCHLAQLLTEQFQKWPQGQGAPGQFPIWLREKNPTPQKANQQSLSLQTLRKIYLLWITENWESACLSRCLWWLNAAIQSQQCIKTTDFSVVLWLACN